MMVIKTKLDEGAMLPQRAHIEDAGADIRSRSLGIVPAHGSAVFDTGVHIAIPEGYYGELTSKSGLNVKHGIQSSGTIDSGYTGSIVVKLYNFSDTDYIVGEGEKISQLIIKKCELPAFIPVDSLEPTQRGEGGFGSTGRF